MAFLLTQKKFSLRSSVAAHGDLQNEVSYAPLPQCIWSGSPSEQIHATGVLAVAELRFFLSAGAGLPEWISYFSNGVGFYLKRACENRSFHSPYGAYGVVNSN